MEVAAGRLCRCPGHCAIPQGQRSGDVSSVSRVRQFTGAAAPRAHRLPHDPPTDGRASASRTGSGALVARLQCQASASRTGPEALVARLSCQASAPRTDCHSIRPNGKDAPGLRTAPRYPLPGNAETGRGGGESVTQQRYRREVSNAETFDGMIRYSTASARSDPGGCGSAAAELAGEGLRAPSSAAAELAGVGLRGPNSATAELAGEGLRTPTSVAAELAMGGLRTPDSAAPQARSPSSAQCPPSWLNDSTPWPNPARSGRMRPRSLSDSRSINKDRASLTPEDGASLTLKDRVSKQSSSEAVGGSADKSRRARAMAAIRSSKIIACLHTGSGEPAYLAAKAALEAGISVLEITSTTPGAFEVLTALRADYPQAVLGIGTVLDMEQAEAARAAGADFLMSPGLDEDLFRATVNWDVLVIPGAMTPSEILRAQKLGASLVKLFPAEAAGGVDTVQAFQRIAPSLGLIPSRGIATSMLTEYLDAGAPAVVFSGAIFSAKLMKEQRYADIGHIASQVLRIAQGGIEPT